MHPPVVVAKQGPPAAHDQGAETPIVDVLRDNATGHAIVAPPVRLRAGGGRSRGRGAAKGIDIELPLRQLPHAPSITNFLATVRLPACQKVDEYAIMR